MSTGKETVSALVLESLPEELSWVGRPQEAELCGLPGRPAVYLLTAPSQVAVQLATTQHLRRLAIARLADPQRVQRGKADLAELVRGIRWREVYSAFEARWWHYRLAREMYPKHYRRLISFGPAWFLHVDWHERVPELRVDKRVWQAPGEHLGPWLTHDTCRQALEGLRGLFDLCRYPEQVRRAPRGQRCAYADMGRCDAPCDGSVPLEHYVQRCRAAWAFAGGAVRPWIDAAKQRMKLAAQEQRFEEAGLIKKQVAWAWRWHDGYAPVVRPAEELNYVLAIPAVRRRAWRLFLFWQGDLIDGPVLTDRKLAAQALPWLRERLERLPAPPDPQVRMEQTWLVAHFLKSKAGESSFTTALPRPEVPSELEDGLRRQVTERRVARAPQASIAAEAPDGANSDN